MISDNKDVDSTLGPTPGLSWDQIFSPIGISLGVLWITFLIWVASFIASGNDQPKPKRGRNSIAKALQHSKISSTHGWATFKALVTCRLIETGFNFFKKLPRRIWNFYIEAVLIPAYRPEWGKYKDWSYRSPDRVEKTEEELIEKEIKKEKARLQKLFELSPSPLAHDHAGCARVRFNINGRIFETQLRTLTRFPDTLLGNPKKISQFYDPETDSFFFDRMPSSFEGILYFFQSGGYLRRPENVHLDIFYDDALFFGLPQSVITKFKIDEGVVGSDATTEQDVMPKSLLQRKIWLLCDYPESSIQARILAICSVFVIVLSIILFCVETIPQFALRIETTTVNGTEVRSVPQQIDLHDPFFLTETICSIWFTAEYLVRLISSPNKWDFIRSWQNIVDLVSIFPYFLTIATAQNTDEVDTSKGGTASLSILRVIRLVRVFRIFKLSRHSRGLKILGLTLRSSMSELFLLIFFVFLGVIMFSSCIYFAEIGENESDNKFISIPHGFWYAVITMTTVGYGETVPASVLGKIVGSLCAITGVLTIALPVPVIVSNFNYFYHQSIDEQEFNFAKLNHVENCPYRPSGGDDVGETKACLSNPMMALVHVSNVGSSVVH